MFEWSSDDSDDGGDDKPVHHTQAQGDLVVFEGDALAEARENGRWLKGGQVRIER